MIAKTPEPPYYAVIFTSVRTPIDEGYAEMAVKMEELAKQQDGFYGFEHARNEIGISICYWSNLDAIKRWKANLDHAMAQKMGKEKWYQAYKVRISIVERDYEFELKNR